MRTHRRLAIASLVAALAATLPGTSPKGQELRSLPAAAAAAAHERAARCPAALEPWTQIDLYLGRGIGAGRAVTERMFKRFLAEEVTPRFPDGLTVLDAAGQFRDGRGRIVREPSKLLVLLVPDRAAAAGKIAAVIDRYKRRFSQESVLRTERSVCLAF